MVSTPLSGGLFVIGCPSSCQEKSAGGSELDVQVRRAVCPTTTSPPPTHCFGVSLVSTGVSGPSGLLIIRGQSYQHQKDLLHKYNEDNFISQKAKARIIRSAKRVIILSVYFKDIKINHSGELSLILTASYSANGVLPYGKNKKMFFLKVIFTCIA